MSDIDFDELDKAVSSLMGKVGDQTLDDGEKTKTLSINTTLKSDEKPDYDRLKAAAGAIGSEALATASERTVVEDLNAPLPESGKPPTLPVEKLAAPTPPVIPVTSRPARGRFMDVRHPSSDMKTANSSSSKPTSVISAPESVTGTNVSTEPMQPSSSQQTPSATSPQPDSLTPFLPDAKVEKRPLGAMQTSFTTDKTEEIATPVNLESTNDDSDPGKDTQAVLDPTKYDAEEAKELQDVQKVESTEVTEPKTSVHEVESGDTEHLKELAEAPGGTASGSPEGGIYDVQPLAHPAKQKSGWGVVIIIVIIIALSAGLGAAAYFILGLGI